MLMRQATPDANERVALALEKYADTVKRVCFMYMKNDADTSDIFQEVFLKFMQHNKTFESDEHEKAWLIRVAINKCKDAHKSFWRRNVGSIDEALEIPTENGDMGELLKIVLSLPPKYKDVIYLFYYEGYTALQITEILNQNANTVYSNLHRARLLLKEKLGGDASEYEF